MISFSEIETHIGEKVVAWNKVLDRIYEELRALGKPDLTSIVIYKTVNQQGYPPFLSDGGEARSKRFQPEQSQTGRTLAEGSWPRFRRVGLERRVTSA
jgi:hypothetical protein